MNNPSSINRRKFIAGTATTAGALLVAPLISKASGFIRPAQSFTVKQVMDLFISQVPGGVLNPTVDTLKAGSPDTVVTGIVTAAFATVEVIRKAIDLGANFIIAHEPTFYNHADSTDWLQNDGVYQYKLNLLNEHKIAVWRNHDYIHHMTPDGVSTGLLAQLGWSQYNDKSTPNIPNIITLPPTTLKDLILHAKDKLHIEKVRFVGNPTQVCKRVLLMPGAGGGKGQIQAIERIKPDVLVCGEIAEWETAEYVRDAQAKGDKLALVVLGHIASEQPGSTYMLAWVKKNLPSIKATEILSGNSLSFM
jgi:putative NIF3 family GTP cyclohydrolase 1 type 2